MRKPFRGCALLLAAALLLPQPQLSGLTAMADNRSAVIRGSVVNVRTSPSTDAGKAGALSSNTSITVTAEVQGSDGYTWYAITGGGISGYVRSDYVKFPTQYTGDADFESYLNQQGFPESYKNGLRQLHAEFPNWVFKAFHTNLDWNTVLDAELSGTGSLVESSSISSWKSTDAGKYDWNTSTWPGFDGATWVAASREIVAYYMDPRNFLDESYVFQFLEQSYKENVQTLSGLQTMLKGSFMEGSVSLTNDSVLRSGSSTSTSASTVTNTASSTASSVSGSDGVIDFSGPGEAGTDSTAVASAKATASAESSASDGTVISSAGPGGTAASSASTDSSMPGGSVSSDSSRSQAGYAEIIMEAAQQSGVSPYVLAAMILQEQGSGSSGSISGQSGYYNYFNVGAYATSDMTAIQRGIWYASQSGSYNRPWTSIEKSIVGGALFYAENYLNAGQNTLYLKKWNVQGSNMYKHQYMTNVPGAAEEGAKLSAAYSSDMKSAAHEFSIPVYLNMPESAAAKPTGDGSPNNKLSSLSVSGFTLTPGFSMDTEQYTLVVDPSVTEVNVSASQAESHAQISGTGTVTLAEASTVVSITVTAQNGSTRTYRITINKGANGQTGGAQSIDSTSSGSVQSSTGIVVVGEGPQ